MARIRSVHPSLFSDEGWVSCSPLARILYIGLWTDADDQGVFEWRPMQLRMRLLPGDNADVSELLSELTRVGLIRPFDAEAKPYGAIKDFQKFQRPRKPNAIYPLPPEQQAYVLGEPDQSDLFGDMRSEPGRVKAGSVTQKSGKSPQMEDGGGRMESEGGRARRNPETPIPDSFPESDDLEKAEMMVTEAGVTLNVTRQAVRFRGHAETNDRRCRNWAAAWRNWMVKSIEDAPVAVPGDRPLTPEEDAAFQAKVFRSWMQDFLKPNGYIWDYHRRGPKPDEPGCAIPPEIMAEFGYTPPRRAQG